MSLIDVGGGSPPKMELRRVSPTQRDADLLQAAMAGLEGFKQTTIFHFLEVAAISLKELYERNLPNGR